MRRETATARKRRCACPSPSGRCVPPEGTDVKLGIGSYTYSWSIGVPGQPQPSSPMSAEDLIDGAAALNVTVVQLCDNVLLPDLNIAALEHLASRAQDRGITLEPGVRGTDPAFIHTMIEVSRILEARLLRTMITATMEQAETDLHG